MAATISIGGKSVPLADIETIVSAIQTSTNMASAGASAADIAKAVLPTLEGVAEDALSLFLPAIPGAGFALGLIIWAIRNKKPLTPELEREWMSHAGTPVGPSGSVDVD